MKYTLLHDIHGFHQDSINCVAFSPNGHFLASGGDDCMLFLYDCLSGQDLVKISSSSNVTSILWHPSSEEIWVGHANGDLQIIDPVCIFLILSPVSFNAYILPQFNTTGSNFPLGLHSSIDCMAFHSKTGYLAVGTDEKILICKVSDKSKLESLISSLPSHTHDHNRKA